MSVRKSKKSIKKKLNIELIYFGRTYYRIWNTLKGKRLILFIQVNSANQGWPFADLDSILEKF